MVVCNRLRKTITTHHRKRKRALGGTLLDASSQQSRALLFFLMWLRIDGLLKRDCFSESRQERPLRISRLGTQEKESQGAEVRVIMSDPEQIRVCYSRTALGPLGLDRPSHMLWVLSTFLGPRCWLLADLITRSNAFLLPISGDYIAGHRLAAARATTQFHIILALCHF